MIDFSCFYFYCTEATVQKVHVICINVQIKAQNQLKHKLNKMYGYMFMKEIYVYF